MAKRSFQTSPSFGILGPLDVAQCSGDNDFTAVDPGTRSEINDVIGAPHRLLIVLNHNERITFTAQRCQRVEQPQIITRVQADRRFIKHVKNTAKIRAELRGETDALRLPATECFRGAAEVQISETDILHETQPLLDFRHQVRGNRLLCSAKFQFLDQISRFASGKIRDLIDGVTLNADMPRDRI
jgi:hypothetical protein